MGGQGGGPSSQGVGPCCEGVGPGEGAYQVVGQGVWGAVGKAEGERGEGGGGEAHRMIQTCLRAKKTGSLHVHVHVYTCFPYLGCIYIQAYTIQAL